MSRTKILSLILFFFFTSCTTAQTTYVCPISNESIVYSLSSSNHSAWNPAMSCAILPCATNTTLNITCRTSSTPCFEYRLIGNISFCAPALHCSLVSPCYGPNFTCPSSASVCVLNSCCSPSTVCIPKVLTETCRTGWISVGILNQGRVRHTASVLPDRRVLITGGISFGVHTDSTEVYEPSTRTWTWAGLLNFPRSAHTATVLLNGQVLVVGGYNQNGFVADTEVYDASTGTWIVNGSLITPRSHHTASLLPDGKLLIVGGSSVPVQINNPFTNCTEIYDPGTGVSTSSCDNMVPRANHVASVLLDGQVLVAGGYNSNGSLRNADVYDPVSGNWTVTNSMHHMRQGHTATVLFNGDVLIVGGFDGSSVLSSCELYNPLNRSWTITGNMSTGRYFHTASILTDGKVLVAGGRISSSNSTSTAELYDPATQTWLSAGMMARERDSHTASVLVNGQILLAGGNDNGVGSNVTNLF